ncbi:MAG: phage portal protein [Thermoguttaceae bacterium]|nr:phage portal protein [Thermoguttaceae bacterium]
MSIFNFFKKSPRRALEATRYDAAQTTRDNVNHWLGALDRLSADQSMSPAVRQTLRSRSRYEVENNAYAKGVVLTLVGDMIGTGPRIQLGEATAIEDAFNAWADEIQLDEKLRSLKYAKTVDGEAFALIVADPKLSTVKFNLVPIDAERVTAGFTASGTLAGTDGIELDAVGRPTYYRVLRDGDLTGTPARVAAANVIHWYRRDRPEQHRGIPELTASLPLFAQLRRYTLAVIASAETAADYAAVIYTDSPAGGEAYSATPFETLSLESRMATTLPDGWKLGQIKPEQPVTNYPQFKREILGEIGRALQMPVNIVTGDSSQHNYASGRLDHQVYHKQITIEQRLCEEAVLTPLFNLWAKEYELATGIKVFSEAQRAERLPSSSKGIVAAGPAGPRWYWDGFEHVDPVKEANAQRTRLGSLTSTLAAEYARNGKDWEVELRQIARERALMRELQIDFMDGFNETVSESRAYAETYTESKSESTRKTESED